MVANLAGHRRARPGRRSGSAGSGPGPDHGPVGRAGLEHGQRAALRRLAAPRHAAALLVPAGHVLGPGRRRPPHGPVRGRHRQPARPDPPELRVRGGDHRRGDRGDDGGRPRRAWPASAAWRGTRAVVRCGAWVVDERRGGRAGLVPTADRPGVRRRQPRPPARQQRAAATTSGSASASGARFVASVVALPPWWTRSGFSSIIRRHRRGRRSQGSRTLAEGHVAGTGAATLGLLAVAVVLAVVIVGRSVLTVPADPDPRRARCCRRGRGADLDGAACPSGSIGVWASALTRCAGCGRSPPSSC